MDAFWSKFGPVTYDSNSEPSLLRQYFEGDKTPYTLSANEMAQAQAYVNTFGNQVMGGVLSTRPDGLMERHIFFGKLPSAAPALDGLLGTATGIFSSTGLVGIRDTFDFDFKSRGGYPFGWQANLGVSMIRSDAWLCGSGNISIPISGGLQ